MPGLINLTRNSKKREQRIFSRYGDQQVREVYIDFLLQDKYTEKQSQEGAPGGYNPPGRARHAWRALVSYAHQAMFPGSFFISKILKYSKTNKKYFYEFFGDCLLTVSRTSLF